MDRFAYLPQAYGQLIGGINFWNHYDPLGTTTCLSRAAGSLSAGYRYNVWGEMQSAVTMGLIFNPFLFIGREGYYSDNEGVNAGLLNLHPPFPLYVRGRFYNPVTGRWLSQDPLGFGGGDYNLYRYVANNPINHTDPSGLQSIIHYGNYCGPSEPEITIDAIDDVDTACMHHDACYGICGGPGGAWGVICPSPCRRSCDRIFCVELARANCDWGVHCNAYRLAAMRIFCGRGMYPI